MNVHKLFSIIIIALQTKLAKKYSQKYLQNKRELIYRRRRATADWTAYFSYLPSRK